MAVQPKNYLIHPSLIRELEKVISGGREVGSQLTYDFLDSLTNPQQTSRFATYVPEGKSSETIYKYVFNRGGAVYRILGIKGTRADGNDQTIIWYKLMPRSAPDKTYKHFRSQGRDIDFENGLSVDSLENLKGIEPRPDLMPAGDVTIKARDGQIFYFVGDRALTFGTSVYNTEAHIHESIVAEVIELCVGNTTGRPILGETPFVKALRASVGSLLIDTGVGDTVDLETFSRLTMAMITETRRANRELADMIFDSPDFDHPGIDARLGIQNIGFHMFDVCLEKTDLADTVVLSVFDDVTETQLTSFKTASPTFSTSQPKLLAASLASALRSEQMLQARTAHQAFLVDPDGEACQLNPEELKDLVPAHKSTLGTPEQMHAWYESRFSPATQSV